MDHGKLRERIHAPYTLSVVNAAARLALVGFNGASSFTESDIGRVVRQVSDESLWRLINHNPVTWHQDNTVTTLPAFGTTAGTICEGNDSRLSRTLSAKELLSAPVTSTAIVSTEVFRTTITSVAGDCYDIRLGTTSTTATTVTNNRRVQIGYRTASNVFTSLGQYLVNSASGGAIRDMMLQCVGVNGAGTSNYLFWGATGASVPIAFTAPSDLILQLNAWVDTSGDTSTINSFKILKASRA